jgi:hypothetical protein
MLTTFAHMHDGSTQFWWFWAVLFGLFEGFALYRAWKYRHKDDNGGTLSEVIWRFNKRHWSARVFTGLFMTWLTVHLVTGWV